MIAPTTLAVAAIFSAVKMYGSADGTRSFHSVVQLRAAYECMSSSARGSGESSPRIVFTVTGKNVRYAAMTETRTQSGGGDPPMRHASQPTDDDRREREDRDRLRRDDVRHDPAPEHVELGEDHPEREPDGGAERNPTAAARAVKSAAWKRYSQRSSPVDVGSPSWRTMSCRCGSVYSLTTNGFVQPVSSHSHRYPSQSAQMPPSTRTNTAARLRTDAPRIDGICHTPDGRAARSGRY